MPRVRRPRKPAESVVPKLALSKLIAKTIDERQLTQTEASWLVGDAPSQISLVVNGRLAGFSAERLLQFVVGLGHDVEIVLRKTPKNRGGKVKVVTK